MLRAGEDCRWSSETAVSALSGVPLEADLVFDVRFMQNPYYVAELRRVSGLTEEVRRFDKKRKNKASNDDWQNPSDPDAKIVYDWAPEGTLIRIHM